MPRSYGSQALPNVTGPLAPLMDALQRHLEVERPQAWKTVLNHSNRLRYLHDELGFNPAAFQADAPQEVERILRRRLATGASNDTYNDDVDCLFHLCNAARIPVRVVKGRRDWIDPAALAPGTVLMAKRHVPKRRDPDPLTDSELARVMAYRHKNPDWNRIIQGLVDWHLYLAKRPEETTLVDVPDVDPDTGRIKIRNPAKLTAIHTVVVPLHVFSRRRPLGAYDAWRRGNREVERTAGRAFWVRPGPHGWERMPPHGITKLFTRLQKWTGVHVTATRLRATGLTLIANSDGTDVLDANRHANHSTLDATMHYVRRAEEERAARIGRSLKDMRHKVGRQHDHNEA